MAHNELSLDDLISDKFLRALDEDILIEEPDMRPSWVKYDEEHTTFKAWSSILNLKCEKEKQIKCYGKLADRKTPKSLFSMKKSEISKKVGISSQSIFNTSSFSEDIFSFFDNENKYLLEIHKKEQVKQRKRHKNTGIRAKKKNEIVNDYQIIDSELQRLRATSAKDTLDLALSEMPLDLRRKLGM